MKPTKLVSSSDILPALKSAGVPYNYAILRVIEQLPSIDAVEVVRCRNCVNWQVDWNPTNCNDEDFRHYCAVLDIYPTGDWFCADGEPKNNENG